MALPYWPGHLGSSSLRPDALAGFTKTIKGAGPKLMSVKSFADLAQAKEFYGSIKKAGQLKFLFDVYNV